MVVLEAESQPGYHSTGRSAAMFMEGYATPTVRALTRASRAFYTAPPAGFADHALLSPRAALLVAAPGQDALLDATEADLRPQAPGLQRLDRDQVLARVPVLRPERVLGGLLDCDAADIDVHALHQGFLRGARANGARIETDARVTALVRDADGWRATSAAGAWRARTVVNAAGAWVDVLAGLAGVAPIGIEPRRRSAFLFPRRPASPVPAGPAWSASTRTGISSPTPVPCSARPPTPTRWRPTTWCPRRSTSLPASTASRP